jgi:hypothetical protein
MQHPVTKAAPTGSTLGAAEREWIRKQGEVARAIEAARHRSTSRFARDVTTSEATRPNSADLAPAHASIATAIRPLGQAAE